jgi:heme A synthase
VIVAVTIAVMLGLAVRVARRPDDRRALREAVTTWLFVGILQAAIGYVQYFNDLPELLVGAHVAGAALLTVATTHLLLCAVPAWADGELRATGTGSETTADGAVAVTSGSQR